MPNRARRLAVGVVTAVVTGLAVVNGGTAAFAAGPDCRKVDSLSSKDLEHCVSDLHSAAEAAARRASKADEAYLQAKQASEDARAQLTSAQDAADEAARTAKLSRTRSAAVTANLARGGGSVGSATEVLLSGGGAGTVLYHLSRMSELGVDSGALAQQAATDQRAADTRHEQAALAAERFADSEQTQKAAFDDAKHEADSTRLLVQRAEAKRSGGQPTERVKYIDLPADASKADKAIAFARSQIGKPYVLGGAGPSTWDCSGLTLMAFESVGVHIGTHSSNDQYHRAESKHLLVPYSAAQPGDLLFYGSGDYYHVAIYSGDGNMVEAPHPGASVREVPVRSGDLAPMVARYTG